MINLHTICTGGSHAQENETYDHEAVIILEEYRGISHRRVMVERLCRTDPVISDSFFQGVDVESDPGTGGGSPSPMIGDAVWVDYRRLGLRRATR